MADVEPSADASGTTARKRRSLFTRARGRFVTDPSSTRNAVLVIVVANVTTILIGGILVWLVDRREYEHLTTAIWYTLQTITTVGYGDVTPTEPVGRLVGGAVMLLGIASLSILTATITSSFIDARQAERQAGEIEEERASRERVESRLDEVLERLGRLEGPAAEDGEVR